jgi:hypothetical protein
MKPNVFCDMITNRILTFLLMLPLCMVWARVDRSGKELVASEVALNGVVPTVKISPVLGTEVAGASFSAFNTSRLITEPAGLVKLYYPLTSATRPTGKAQVSVTVQYLALENDKLVAQTATGTLSIALLDASLKSVDMLSLPAAVRIISTTVTAAAVDAPLVAGIKLSHEVYAQVYEVLKLQSPSALSPGFALTHSAAQLASNGTLDVTWTALPGAESYELEWTYVSDQDPNPQVTTRLSCDKVVVRDYLFRHNSSRV